MWQRPSAHPAAPPQQREGQAHLPASHHPGQASHVAEGVCKRRCAAPHSLLHFPPPPSYPPPFPSTSKMADDVLNLPGPSTHVNSPGPNDYSYAYYEPGPPTKHTNVPSKYPGVYREGSYRTRHTYMTRYGTEENIYEEISDLERARLNIHRHKESIMSLSQSLVEEEVRRVQSGHRRVLGELNLSVEAMLMPSGSREGSDDTDREGEDQLADLMTVGPTDELLSPVPIVDLDSGFSGSSSGTSYRSAAGSLRRGPERPKSGGGSAGGGTVTVRNSGEGSSSAGGRSFWGKKTWRKLAAFPSNISLNKGGATNSGTSRGMCSVS